MSPEGGCYTARLDRAKTLPPGLIKFEQFELDCARFELRHAGRAQKLEKIPMELLMILATAEGRLVSRKEIEERLWGKGVFVDTEHGINTAIRKIRQVLGDDPEHPRFVQTVQRKGYRFIADVAVNQEVQSQNDGATSGERGVSSPSSEPNQLNLSDPRAAAADEAPVPRVAQTADSFGLALPQGYCLCGRFTSSPRLASNAAEHSRQQSGPSRYCRWKIFQAMPQRSISRTG